MPTNFVIGQIVILLSAPEVQRSKGKAFSFPLKCLLAYSALVFVPVTAWSFYGYTDWSAVYLHPISVIPPWAGPAFLLQYFTGMLFGGLLAQTLIQLGRTRLVFLTLLLGILWLAGIWGFTLDQYMHIGTFEQYRTGTAPALADSPAFQKQLNIWGALIALPLIGLAFYLFKRSQKMSRKWFRPTTY